jgi:hypothetical protein
MGLQDKVLLVLSEHSIASSWIKDEVTKAFFEEQKRGDLVPFPIRIGCAYTGGLHLVRDVRRQSLLGDAAAQTIRDRKFLL